MRDRHNRRKISLKSRYRGTNKAKQPEEKLSGLLHPETVARKNAEFIFTIITVFLGLYFAYQANALANDNRKQDAMINQLRGQTKRLTALVTTTDLQSRRINDQLGVLVKNHFNDSTHFQLTVFAPLLSNLISNVISLDIDDLDEMQSYEFKDGQMPDGIIECLKNVERKVNEILNNPITLMHKKERSKLVAVSPDVRDFRKRLNDLSVQNSFQLYVKKEENVEILNGELKKVRSDLFYFIQLASKYQTEWYQFRPIK